MKKSYVNHSNSSELSESSNFASQLMLLLKKDILNGVFKPNEKLIMARLKKHYNVGTSPLREALSQLLVEQLVIVEDQRGFRVHPISYDEMIDLYQTRAHIEALCVVQAIEQAYSIVILIWRKKLCSLISTLLGQRWTKYFPKRNKD